MISICLTIKDRSKFIFEGREIVLFPKVVRSIVEAIRGNEDKFEIIVSDFNSTDMPMLDWLPELLNGLNYKIITVNSEFFSRGLGLNTSAANSSGDTLFFLDADTTFSKQAADLLLTYETSGKCFFPIVADWQDIDHTKFEMYTDSFGNCMIPKHIFEAVGGWKEWFSWGCEDNILLLTLQGHGVKIIRHPVDGMFHLWHPRVPRAYDKPFEEYKDHFHYKNYKNPSRFDVDKFLRERGLDSWIPSKMRYDEPPER